MGKSKKPSTTSFRRSIQWISLQGEEELEEKKGYKPMDTRNEEATDNKKRYKNSLVFWSINLKGNLKISKKTKEQYKM